MTLKQLATNDMAKAGEKVIATKYDQNPKFMSSQEMYDIMFILDIHKISYNFNEYPYNAKIVLPNGQELMFIKYLTRTKNVYKYFVNRSTRNKFADALFAGTYKVTKMNKIEKGEFNISPAFVEALKSFENPIISIKAAVSFIKEIVCLFKKKIN